MLRALLLLCALGLAGMAAIPLAGHLVGVQLMASGTPTTGSGGPIILLANNFVVALFWLVGWLTLALLCAAAAVGLDQQHRLLRLQREGGRPTEPTRRPAAEELPAASVTRRPPQEPRFEPKVAARVEPQLQPRRVEEPPAHPRGPVLRADR